MCVSQGYVTFLNYFSSQSNRRLSSAFPSFPFVHYFCFTFYLAPPLQTIQMSQYSVSFYHISTRCLCQKLQRFLARDQFIHNNNIVKYVWYWQIFFLKLLFYCSFLHFFLEWCQGVAVMVVWQGQGSVPEVV